MCLGAIANGITRLGFTEHFDLLPVDPCFNYLNLEGWWEELRRCRSLFSGQLTLLAGIELGEPHRYPDQIRRLLADHPWDYALGSLHWVGDELIFDREYFRRLPDRAYRDYFAELGQMAADADFDILAHMDVVKRLGFDVYGQYHAERYEPEIRLVLHTLAERGLALEINTGQLRRPVGESSPASPVLEWFHQEGGRWVTLGSDAHQPDHIGFRLQSAAESARAAGFEHVAWFEQRAAAQER